MTETDNANKNDENERFIALGHAHAHLAHEIRHFLVTIGLLARSLLKSEQLAGNDRETVQRIIEQENLAEELLQDALGLVTPLKDKRTVQDLRVVLREVAKALAARAQEAGVTLDVVCDETQPCPVPMVEKQLRQAFLNLAGNAIDAAASSEGGFVRLQADATPHHITITLEDNGPGMTEEEAHRMFEPFRSSKEGGTGLGLALAEKLIHEHDGDLAVGSCPDEGTTITVRLPRADGDTEDTDT